MTDKIKVFLSYSHKDKIHCDELLDQLGALRHGGAVATWTDRDIEAGSNWEEEIRRELAAADLILMLISPGFIGSKFCYSVEMKAAIERHDSGGAVVIPISIRSCDWEDTPFSKIQGLPVDLTPILSLAQFALG